MVFVVFMQIAANLRLLIDGDADLQDGNSLFFFDVFDTAVLFLRDGSTYAFVGLRQAISSALSPLDIFPSGTVPWAAP